MNAEYMCQNLDLNALFKCSFNLNKTEHKILLFVLKENKNLSIKEISQKLSLERSTVQKAIKSLTDKSLIERKQQNLEEGGYRFCYSAVKKSVIKEKMFESVRNWHGSVETMINKW